MRVNTPDDSQADQVTDRTHLIKLSVGTQSVESLEAWQTQPRAQTADGLPRHITRMWPKRQEQLLNGGSIYWVIKGSVLCRQRVLRLDEVTGADGRPHCAIVMEPTLHRTVAALRRPFQGWRYLSPGDAPADLAPGRESDDTLPVDLDRALAEIGVL